MGVETDQIDCETALPVLVLKYIVNGGCFRGVADRIDCETTLPVLVSKYVVNGGYFGGDVRLHMN